jgi:hypothetical protein
MATTSAEKTSARGSTSDPPEEPVGATGRVGETAMGEIVVVVLVHGELGVEVEVLPGQRE